MHESLKSGRRLLLLVQAGNCCSSFRQETVAPRSDRRLLLLFRQETVAPRSDRRLLLLVQTGDCCSSFRQETVAPRSDRRLLLLVQAGDYCSSFRQETFRQETCSSFRQETVAPRSFFFAFLALCGDSFRIFCLCYCWYDLQSPDELSIYLSPAVASVHTAMFIRRLILATSIRHFHKSNCRQRLFGVEMCLKDNQMTTDRVGVSTEKQQKSGISGSRNNLNIICRKMK